MRARLSYWAAYASALVLCTVTLQPAGAASTPLFTICTFPSKPLVTCDPSLKPETYTGYEIELVRRAGEIMNWVEGVNNNTDADARYTFKCMRLSEVLDDLLADQGNCSFAVGGITVSTDRQNAGLKFSWPTYHASLAVLTTAEVQQAQRGWYFLRPFQGAVWGAIGATLLLIPILAFLLEFLAIQGRVGHRDWYPGLKEATWRVMWTQLLFDPLQVTSVAARILAITYGFFCVILLNTFTANLTAFMTVRQIQSSINGINDLRGKAVGTLQVYESRLAKYGVASVVQPFLGEASQLQWVTDLRSGTMAAFVIDDPLISYMAATSGCDIRMLPETVEPFDYAMTFRGSTPDNLLDEMSRAIITLEEEGILEWLRTTYIRIPNSICEQELNGSDTFSISFTELYGLWVILAGGVLVSFLYLLSLLWWKRRRARHVQRAKHAAQHLPHTSPGGGPLRDDSTWASKPAAAPTSSAAMVVSLPAPKPSQQDVEGTPVGQMVQDDYEEGKSEGGWVGDDEGWHPWVAFEQSVSLWGRHLAANLRHKAAREGRKARGKLPPAAPGRPPWQGRGGVGGGTGPPGQQCAGEGGCQGSRGAGPGGDAVVGRVEGVHSGALTQGESALTQGERALLAQLLAVVRGYEAELQQQQGASGGQAGAGMGRTAAADASAVPPWYYRSPSGLTCFVDEAVDEARWVHGSGGRGQSEAGEGEG